MAIFLPVVKIVYGQGFLIINEADYDSTKDQLWSDRDEKVHRGPQGKAEVSLSDDGTRQEGGESTKSETEDARLTRAEREAELYAIYEKGYSGVKAIAASHGITERPTDGWDAAIPMILDAEFGAENE